MMMWIPQDPFNTGALHAFLLNLDDIPIITRKNKHATFADYGNQNTKRPLYQDVAKTIKQQTAK